MQDQCGAGGAFVLEAGSKCGVNTRPDCAGF